MTSRRRFLRWAGTSVAVFAGCSSSGDDDDAPVIGTTPSATRSGDDSADSTDRATSERATDDESRPTGDVWGSWPLVGRTPRNHTYNGTAIGPRGDVAQRWQWSIDLPDSAKMSTVRYSGPVVADGLAFVSAAGTYYDAGTGTTTSDSLQRHDVSALYALDAASGKTVWRRDFDTNHTSYVVTPAVAGDAVVACYGTNLVAVDSAEGSERWTRSDVSPMNGPQAAGSDLFLPEMSGLSRYDAADGSEVWTALSEDHPPNGCPLAVAGDDVFVSAGSDVVRLDRGDGSERWRTTAGVVSERVYGGAPGQVHAPVVTDDAVFVAGGPKMLYSRGDAGLTALDREDGTVRWQTRPEGTSGNQNATGVYGIPVLLDGTLYVTGWTEGDPNLYAFDATTGDLQWAKPVEGVGEYHVGAKDVVYVVSEEHVEAFSTADGTRLGGLSPEDATFNFVGNAVVGSLLFASGLQGVRAFGPA